MKDNIKMKFTYIGSSSDLETKFRQSINKVCGNGVFDMEISESEFESLKRSMSFCLLNTSYIISNITLNIGDDNYYSIDVRSDDDLVCKIDTFKISGNKHRLTSGDQDDIIC